MTAPKKPDWATTPNARRKRPMRTITMSPEGWARLDELRGDQARGAYVEYLLGTCKSRGTKLSRRNRP